MIKIRNLSYNNSGFSLRIINLSIKEHEKVAIIGYNGSGKTTLLKLLSGFFSISSGRCLRKLKIPVEDH